MLLALGHHTHMHTAAENGHRIHCSAEAMMAVGSAWHYYYCYCTAVLSTVQLVITLLWTRVRLPQIGLAPAPLKCFCLVSCAMQRSVCCFSFRSPVCLAVFHSCVNKQQASVLTFGQYAAIRRLTSVLSSLASAFAASMLAGRSPGSAPAFLHQQTVASSYIAALQGARSS